MKARLSGTLVALGMALLALTPAAPEPVRNFDLVAVHLYRAFDAGWKYLRNPIGPAPARTRADEELARRIGAGLERWERVLRGEQDGATQAAFIARLIDVDVRTRRLLVDAGDGVVLKEGDAVIAHDVAIGLVESATGGVAVVRTPWTHEARFSGMVEVAAADLSPVRLILRGLDRRGDWSAAVMTPEKKHDLEAGATVFVPGVDDLLPASVARLPEGLKLGVLAVDDETAQRSGTQAWCALPSIDILRLDAVAVIPRTPRSKDWTPGFRTVPAQALSFGLLTPRRDGRILAGLGIPDGGAVTAAGYYLGTVEASVAGAARVRGIFDPGLHTFVMLIGADGTFPLLVRAERAISNGGVLTVVNGSRSARPGDLVVTSGRGAHVPRGLIVGKVAKVDGDRLTLVRPLQPVDAPVQVHTRRDFPRDPWGGGG